VKGLEPSFLFTLLCPQRLKVDIGRFASLEFLRSRCRTTQPCRCDFGGIRISGLENPENVLRSAQQPPGAVLKLDEEPPHFGNV
jgi:hypothetical protein